MGDAGDDFDSGGNGACGRHDGGVGDAGDYLNWRAANGLPPLARMGESDSFDTFSEDGATEGEPSSALTAPPPKVRSFVATPLLLALRSHLASRPTGRLIGRWITGVVQFPLPPLRDETSN